MKGHPARKFSPESMMMSYGYDSSLSEGAIKSPIFQTSTFAFKTAEEGKAFFELAYGLRTKKPAEQLGLIYSRINNPDLEILEDRLTLWDEGEEAAVFESGMAAITTTLFEFLKPGDLLVASGPLYGGTDHFIHHVLPAWGINVLRFSPAQTMDEVWAMVKKSPHANRLAMIFLETPANPTNALIDIEGCVSLAKEFSTPERTVHVAVDNTYMGPLWQHPLKHGADLVLYSATKYIGGHSDLIAGAVIGSFELIKRVKALRTFFGNMAGPWTGWLLMRSLETLKVRMEAQARGAEKVAQFLKTHPKVERVYYPGFFEEGTRQHEIFTRQCLSAGAMLSFDVKGGEAEAFQFLNSLKMIQLAVSLGGTESLAEHPFTMTHADVPAFEKESLGVSEKMIRLSIGVENPDDIIWDVEQALALVASVPAEQTENHLA
ncbi:MAG: cystathionine gamma-synthase family protein [Acidobacteriota bacterium]